MTGSGFCPVSFNSYGVFFASLQEATFFSGCFAVLFLFFPLQDFVTTGGGFGPVSFDGYGVSYIVAGDDVLFFHVSSRVSSVATDSRRFVAAIQRSLKDIKRLFESNGIRIPNKSAGSGVSDTSVVNNNDDVDNRDNQFAKRFRELRREQ